MTILVLYTCMIRMLLKFQIKTDTTSVHAKKQSNNAPCTPINQVSSFKPHHCIVHQLEIRRYYSYAKFSLILNIFIHVYICVCVCVCKIGL